MNNKKMMLDQLIEENNGYLIASIATANGDVSRTFLSQYVKEKEMEKLKNLNALETECSKLTLEEVFVAETEAESDNEKIRNVFK